MNESNRIIFGSIYLNVILAATDRICQIVYYGKTKFISETINNTCLAFILIPTCLNIIMMIIYLFFQNDFNINIRTKIKYFIYYICSAEVCYSIGVHKSFKSKFSQYSDDILITKKVLNVMHILFVSLPQILIITIHSSSKAEFIGIDLVSLLFSCLFIVWSICYYVLCTVKEADYEVELEDYVN